MPTAQMQRSVLLFLSVLLVIAARSPAEELRQPVTGILGAMPAEVDTLTDKLVNRTSNTFLGIQFTTGELEDRRVVIASTGVGKVNAAMTATLLLDHFHPSEVIFTGIAGGINPELNPGDIVSSRSYVILNLPTTEILFSSIPTRPLED